MSSRKGRGGVHPLLCLSGTAILAGHSRPTQRHPPHDTHALPLGRKPSLDARPPQGGCTTAARPHSPGHGDHSCGPAAEPSPATDWSCASDRKPGRAVHACGTLGRGGHQRLEPGQARLCNHSVWTGADRRAVQVTVTLHCLEGCGGKGVRKSTRRQERALSWESGNLALG